MDWMTKTTALEGKGLARADIVESQRRLGDNAKKTIAAAEAVEETPGGTEILEASKGAAEQPKLHQGQSGYRKAVWPVWPD